MKQTLSLDLRQKFVDDLGVPIKLIQSPYFEYYLELYSNSFEIEKKLSMYLEDIEKYGKEGLKKEWYTVKDNIEKDIKSQPEFIKLQNEIFNETITFPLEKGNPYNEYFLDKTCVSIDIRSANFTALKHYHPSLVLNCETYSELLSRYTESKTLKESKIFRQLVFEPILAKKQAQIQRKIIDEVAKILVPKLNPEKSRAVSNDELVLAFSKEESLSSIQNRIEKEVLSLPYKDILKVEIFNVFHLDANFFYKKDSNGKITLRNVPAQVYPQCFKKAHGLPIEEMDLVFLDSLTQKVAKYNCDIFTKDTK